jgi:DNA polymerase sigma
MSVASAGTRFKSEVLRALAAMDGRLPALVRLVKLWAGRHALNDATSGTFNSHALTLMARGITTLTLSLPDAAS